VNSLQVSLVLDKSVAGQKAALQAAVSRAAGLNPTRGDLITTSVLPFAKQTPVVPKTGPVPTTMLGPLKWVGLGLATLIFMFFMSRALKRREGETLAKPSWLTEIEQPTTLSQLEAGNGMGQLTMGGGETVALPPRTPDTGAQALEQLVDREPDRVAAQMRAWMAED
jgi:flagellar M-ring protein FliF